MSKNKTSKPKHVAMRTCVVCRRKLEKRRLTRVVLTPDSGAVIDPSGKRNGRGAYLCDQVSCWEKATTIAAILNQALKAEIPRAELEEIARHRPVD